MPTDILRTSLFCFCLAVLGCSSSDATPASAPDPTRACVKRDLTWFDCVDPRYDPGAKDTVWCLDVYGADECVQAATTGDDIHGLCIATRSQVATYHATQSCADLDGGAGGAGGAGGSTDSR